MYALSHVAFIWFALGFVGLDMGSGVGLIARLLDEFELFRKLAGFMIFLYSEQI